MKSRLIYPIDSQKWLILRRTDLISLLFLTQKRYQVLHCNEGFHLQNSSVRCQYLPTTYVGLLHPIMFFHMPTYLIVCDITQAGTVHIRQIFRHWITTLKSHLTSTHDLCITMQPHQPRNYRRFSITVFELASVSGKVHFTLLVCLFKWNAIHSFSCGFRMPVASAEKIANHVVSADSYFSYLIWFTSSPLSHYGSNFQPFWL